jgi:hypothetical protein
VAIHGHLVYISPAQNRRIFCTYVRSVDKWALLLGGLRVYTHVALDLA